LKELFGSLVYGELKIMISCMVVSFASILNKPDVIIYGKE
jgi:hypothetical protein